MRLTHAMLVVVDISGYTRFITRRTLSLMHAERVISALMNSVIDRSRHPLVLNKLEGDAALLFGEIEPDDVEAARDVFSQVRGFFEAFDARLAELKAVPGNCNCEACTNLQSLGLKAFVHAGEIAIKQVRQFEELAGEPVILLHRLMKNSVAERVYVLSTPEAASLARFGHDLVREHTEVVEGFGERRLWLIEPQRLPQTPGVPAPGAQPGSAPQRRWRRAPWIARLVARWWSS